MLKRTIWDSLIEWKKTGSSPAGHQGIKADRENIYRPSVS